MSEDVRLTLYVTPSLKRTILELAKANRPKVTMSAMGTYLLKIGLQEYQEDKEGKDGES